MKQLLFNPLQAVMTVLLSTLLLFSCSQIETFEASELVESQEKLAVILRTSSGYENFRIADGVDACAIKHVDLVVGNDKVKDADGNEIGEVSVYKDNVSAYVTISIFDRANGHDNGWFITKADVFVGAISELGIKKNPAPGKFDNRIVAKTDGTGEKDVTFSYPLSNFNNLGTLNYAVHADLVQVQVNPDGTIKMDGDGMAFPEKFEGAWGRGTRFTDKGNWAMHFSHDITQVCATSCNDTWSKLTGGITRADFGNNDQKEFTMDEESDEYSIPVNGLDGEEYGKFTVRHRKFNNASNASNRDVEYKFELNSDLAEDISVNAVEFMFSESTFTFGDLNGVTSLAKIFDERSTDWVLVGKSTNTENTIFAGFKVKFNGVCPAPQP